MKRILVSVLLVIMSVTVLSCGKSSSQSKISEKPYILFWGGDNNHLKTAAELKCNALVAGCKGEELKLLIKNAAKYDIDIYTALIPAYSSSKNAQYQQVMSEEEQKLFKQIKSKGYRSKNSYQIGGEPPEGTVEVLNSQIGCFHRREVAAETKKQLKELIDAYPGLAGIAFDKFCYQNYKCCYCDESERQLAEFRGENPSLSLQEAREKFSLQSLVGFYNEIADYARELKPGIKTSAHLWPVYLPKPLFGNQLNIDYCNQSVAWFFKPYWSDEKIISYTREVVNNDKKYYSRQVGIPFVGMYCNKKNETLNKNAERFKHEMDLVLSATKKRRFAVHSTVSVIESPEHLKAMKEVFAKHGIINEDKE